MLMVVLTLVGVLWLGLIVLALGLCVAASRADERAAATPPRLSVLPSDQPARERTDRSARDRRPPPSGASGAA